MITTIFRIGARSLIASRTSFVSCALGGCFFGWLPSVTWVPVFCVCDRNVFIFIVLSAPRRGLPRKNGSTQNNHSTLRARGSPRGRREGASTGRSRASKGRALAAPLERRDAPVCGRSTRRFCTIRSLIGSIWHKAANCDIMSLLAALCIISPYSPRSTLSQC